MSGGSSYVQYRPLRAPRQDRETLVEPPWNEVSGLVAENVRRRSQCRYDFQGRTLAQLLQQAREELLQQAYAWTTSYRDVERRAMKPQGLVFLSGHQPELFHPGVWFKNFALAGLAARHGATAVNLIIDSDAFKQGAVRVPGGPAASPHVAAVPLDVPGPNVPYEERSILDRRVFAEFGSRAAAQLAGLVSAPLVSRFWPLAIGRMRETDRLGACLAQARHQLEAQWGLATLEVPQSQVCETESFAWFCCHLLAHLPRLHATYNGLLARYRAAHRIRSAAHPVPDLAADGPWLEAPFWVWNAENPKRRRLFARQQGSQLLLADGDQWGACLPLSREGELNRAVTHLLELAQRGVKIRSRALVTTLWARLVLGDLFLHGIGGAKYDQVTDALMAELFGLEPPRFMVLSATLLLPVPRPRVTVDDLRAVRQRLRELTYHPERFLANSPWTLPDGRDGPAALAAAKLRWVHTPKTRENARLRHQEIRRVNEALQAWLEAERRRTAEREKLVRAALCAETVLSSREYSFCLYPEELLRDFFFGLLAGI